MFEAESVKKWFALLTRWNLERTVESELASEEAITPRRSLQTGAWVRVARGRLRIAGRFAEIEIFDPIRGERQIA